MSENTLFKEIEEDLERQKLEAFWKKYGFWIILAAIGLVISTASSTAYRAWKADRDQRLTMELLTARRDVGDLTKNIEQLVSYASKTPRNLGALALLHAGALAVDGGNKAKAIEIFNRLEAEEQADPAYRQLGTLLSVQEQLDVGDAAALAARLQPLTADGAAWRASALEDQVYLALRTGDRTKAKDILTVLTRDVATPRTIMDRAQTLLGSLNGGNP